MTYVCSACTYPSRRSDGCDNPGCVENVTHTPERREELRRLQIIEADRRKAEELRQKERKRLQAWARRNGGASI